MNRARIVAFERADWDDKMLTMDGLEEFLPTLSDTEDPTLTVNTLYKLFGDQPVVALQPSEEPRGPMFDPTSDAGSLEAFFRRLEQTTVPAADAAVAVDDAVYEAVASFSSDEDTIEDVGASAELHGSAVTATQQVALDFQRFAEKFHAFAAECQQR